MVADAETFAEEDELLKKKIEARNSFENCQSLSLPPYSLRPNSAIENPRLTNFEIE